MSETFNPRNSMESRHAADVSKAVIASLKERAEGAERAVTDMLHALGCEIVPVDYAATMATAKRQAIDILKRELGEAEAQRDAARAVLREVEWKGHVGAPVCPVCLANRWEMSPHAPDCRLAAALGDKENEPDPRECDPPSDYDLDGGPAAEHKETERA